MRQKLTHIDFLKALAMFLVACGHWIGTGTFAYEVHGIISGTLAEPILPGNLHSLWKLENYLYQTFMTNPGGLGTTLFFLCSGYLVAFSITRYNRREWVTSRIFRIFPVLIAATVINGLFIFFLQGIRYPLESYLVTVTLTFGIIPVEATTGVLWFLQVVFAYYLLAAFVREFTWEKIYCWFSFILLAQIIAWKIPDRNVIWFASLLRYMSYLLVGAAFQIVDTKPDNRNIFYTGASILFCFSIFKVDRYLLQDTTVYHTTGNVLLATGIFIFVICLAHWKHGIFHCFGSALETAMSISMPFYLIHTTVGILTMYYVRTHGASVYIALLAALTVTVILSFLIRNLVERPAIRFGKRLWTALAQPFSSTDQVSQTTESGFMAKAKKSAPIVVSVDDASMMFNVASEKVDNLKEYVIKLLKKKLYFEEFWALRHISVQIRHQESFAIIGLNGSGKSTLLKLISGVLKPTDGQITVLGSIAPLLELGAGFDMELSARENIYLNGCVLGYTEKQMQKKYDSIVAFSELEHFMDMPIKNFSSGMLARLGFAIATDVQPDILILDEVLAVGDYLFQKKCEDRIERMQAEGTTIILVSHSTEQVRKLCRKALWLEHGEMRMYGEVDAVCDAYENK